MLRQLSLDFLHPDDIARSMAAFEIVLRGEPVLRFENRYRATDGTYRWFSWVAVPEADKFYCTVRDVTDDKHNVETIATQKAEAELREQFLAVLGHDLRNPVGAIGAGVKLLHRRATERELDRDTHANAKQRASYVGVDRQSHGFCARAAGRRAPLQRRSSALLRKCGLSLPMQKSKRTSACHGH